MTRHRLRRCALCLACLLLVPPILWIGVVLLAPTSWVKQRVVTALEKSSGRSVKLERLAVPLLGGIELTGIAFGSPGNTDDPWLKAEKVRLDVNLCELVRGRLEPASIEIEGSELRVLRRGDGSLELADFIMPRYQGRTPGKRADGPERIDIHFHGSTVMVIDLPSKTHLHLQNVEGDGALEGKRIVVQNMRGTLNGGNFQFSGQLDRTDMEPTLEARLRAREGRSG